MTKINLPFILVSILCFGLISSASTYAMWDGSKKLESSGKVPISLVLLTIHGAFRFANEFFASWDQSATTDAKIKSATEQSENLEFRYGEDSTLENARVIFLNEDPMNIDDLEEMLHFLKSTIREGDAIVLEGFGVTQSVDIPTLELLYARRLFCLFPFRQPKYVKIDEIRERAEIFDQQADAFECLTHRGDIGSESIPVLQWPCDSDIPERARQQALSIRTALKSHSRVFVLRNRAFSLSFMHELLNRKPKLKEALGARLRRSLDSMSDLLECEQFWLFSALGALELSLTDIPHVDVFSKNAFKK